MGLDWTIPDLVTVSQLEVFWMPNNSMFGIFPNLTGLSNLRIFNIASNKLADTLPNITYLQSLTYLNLSNSGVFGIVDTRLPASLTTCSLQGSRASDFETCYFLFPPACSANNQTFYQWKSSCPDSDIPVPAQIAGASSSSALQARTSAGSGSPDTSPSQAISAPPPAATATATQPIGTTSSPSTSPASSALNVPLIAGIAGGTVAVLSVVAGLVLPRIRRRNMEAKWKHMESTKMDNLGGPKGGDDGTGGNGTFTFDFAAGKFVPSAPASVSDGSSTLNNSRTVTNSSSKASTVGRTMSGTLTEFSQFQKSDTMSVEMHAGFFFRCAAPRDLEDEAFVTYEGEETFLVSHNFDPSSDDEIALHKGDIVRPKVVFRDGWLAVENVDTGEYGMVPTDCVRLGTTVPSVPLNFASRIESQAPRYTGVIASRGYHLAGMESSAVSQSGHAGYSKEWLRVAGSNSMSGDLVGRYAMPQNEPAGLMDGSRAYGNVPSSFTVMGASQRYNEGLIAERPWQGHQGRSVASLQSAYVDVRGAVARSGRLGPDPRVTGLSSKVETVRLQSARVDVRGPATQGL
ncbi:hypothetical protein HDU93_006610 [Gonapodya sp. JEL0774]|nr:hypothetical protein HDU93_006610 [Gonapodya sp. JEL0774]